MFLQKTSYNHPETLKNQIFKDEMNEKKSLIVDEAVEVQIEALDRLSKMVRVVTERLEQELSKAKILARVGGRVKNPESLRKKLVSWAQDPQKSDRIKSPADVFEQIGDLAAVRVMTYMEKDRDEVARIAMKVFNHREGREDFEMEIKEKDPRIAKDPHNFYRATHLQICLKKEDLDETNISLKRSHCELQITSMLAHVWNEVEHDIVYKGDRAALSDSERSAIESLGLMTKSGDNIIESLINAQNHRMRDLERQSQIEGLKFQGPEQLSAFLEHHFGDKIAGLNMNYTQSAKELLATLQYLGWDSRSEVSARFSPSHMNKARREGLRFNRFLNKVGKTRPAFQVDCCDLFLIASFMLEKQKLIDAFQDLHANRREVAFLNSFREMS